MVSRAERTPFSAWWWTVDRLMLAALGAVMLGGIILSLAASPPVAARIGLDPFYFVNRHILYPDPDHHRSHRDLVPVAASPAPGRARRLHHQRRDGGRDALRRRRDQGRAALDRARRGQHPALRVPQALFRRAGVLAVRGIVAQVRRARRPPSACCCWAASSPSWCRSRISARPCWWRSCGAPCSSWRACGSSG